MKGILPFLTASEHATNWVEALQCYLRCAGALQGIYSPTNSELIHGIKKMTTSWGLTLFYYNMVKRSSICCVESSVAAAALQQYQTLGNFNGMKRIFDEDIDVHTAIGAQSALILASHTGMWEKALHLYQSNPSLSRNSRIRKSIVKTLSLHNLWEVSLGILGNQYSRDVTPSLIQPVVKSLSRLNHHDKALKIAANSFAAGYTINTELFFGLIYTIERCSGWCSALQCAHDLRLFSQQTILKGYHLALYNALVDCLYESNVYHGFSIDEVITDITERLSHRVNFSRNSDSRKSFRLLTFQDVQQRYLSIIQPLSHSYEKLIKIPFWYLKNPSSIVDEIYQSNSTGIVLDTNFIMQCISKNLPLDHFLPSIIHQYPEIKDRNFDVTVIPFTVVQEVHHLVWDTQSRMRYAVRVLLWSRFLAFVRRSNVYCIPLSTEYPCTFLSILTEMAYKKSNRDSSCCYRSNPDVRILNLCLALTHYIRCKEIGLLQGSTPTEGIMLFSYLKYHVRRFTNTVKSPTSNRLLLCTLDKSLSKAAIDAGLLSFPLLRN